VTDDDFKHLLCGFGAPYRCEKCAMRELLDRQLFEAVGPRRYRELQQSSGNSE